MNENSQTIRLTIKIFIIIANTYALGRLPSQGTLTWHFPQPYLGACFSLVFSKKAKQALWSLPFSTDIALAGQFLPHAPHMVQYS